MLQLDLSIWNYSLSQLIEHGLVHSFIYRCACDNIYCLFKLYVYKKRYCVTDLKTGLDYFNTCCRLMTVYCCALNSCKGHQLTGKSSYVSLIVAFKRGVKHDITAVCSEASNPLAPVPVLNARRRLQIS